MYSTFGLRFELWLRFGFGFGFWFGFGFAFGFWGDIVGQYLWVRVMVTFKFWFGFRLGLGFGVTLLYITFGRSTIHGPLLPGTTMSVCFRT